MGQEIGKEYGTTGDTDDDNEEGGNMVAVKLTNSCKGKIRDDTSGIGAGTWLVVASGEGAKEATTEEALART
ncbi:19985_t:CDS:1, partial [Cetraspora pellucida]